MRLDTIIGWTLVTTTAVLLLWFYATAAWRSLSTIVVRDKQAVWDAHCGPVTGPPTYDLLRAGCASDGVACRMSGREQTTEIVVVLDRWDYDTHPGDCCPQRDGDVMTVCCRECAGTGVFPMPWIDSPAEGLADMEACSDVRCKGSGRQIVAFANPHNMPEQHRPEDTP